MNKMYYSIEFDLQKTILTSLHYNILDNFSKDKILLQVSSDPIRSFILVDSDEAIKKWQSQNIPVIAWSHENNPDESLMGTPWMILSLDALTEEYLEEIHCRYYHLPLTILKTDRCYLRELTMDDYPLLKKCDLEQAPDSAGRFFSASQNINSQEEEMNYLSHYIDHQYPFYGFGIYAAFLKENDDFLGIAGFSCCQEAELEIGYAVMTTQRRKGYASEWVKALKKYALENLEIKDLLARIGPDNIPSIRLARKCGIKIMLG